MNGSRRRRGALALGLLTLAAMGAARGGGSQWFEIDDFRQQPSLRMHDMVVTADGGLSIGPASRARLGPSLPTIWKLRRGEGGVLYAAGGDPGTLLALPAGKEGRVMLQVESAALTALAVLGDGSVLAAESPGGRIHQLAADGSPLRTLATGAAYVWDMVADGSGGLWIATGMPGAVMHWRPGEDAVQTVLSLGLRQARCLARLPEGPGVLVGTAGRGQLLQVSRQAAVRTLVEVAEEEVVAVLPEAGGQVLLAAAGGDAAGPEHGAKPAGAQGNEDQSKGAAGALYRLDAGGELTELWRSAQEIPLSLVHMGEGESRTVWAGFSPRGPIRELEAPGRWRLIGQLDAASITDLEPLDAHRVAVATAGQGSIRVLDRSVAGEGLVQSPVHDAGPGAVFGGMELGMRRGRESDVELSFRSGPTADPGNAWSPWSVWRKSGQVRAPVAPPGRYVQWRARLTAPSSKEAPEMARLAISYLPANRAPIISKVEVLPPGVAVQRLPAPPGQAGLQAGSPVAQALSGSPTASTVPLRKLFITGRRSITWESRDPDGDPLAARITIQADAETAFRPFATVEGERFFVFEESRLADGGYVLQVEVHDEGGNTSTRSRSARLASERFIVDRTPPQVKDVAVHRRQGATFLQFTIHDGGSGPATARFALADGAFRAVLPEDGIEDSPTEGYRLTLEENAAGKVVTIEARDRAGNISSWRETIPAGR